MSDKNILVELHKAGFKQNNKWLVEGVSLKVEKGKIVTLIGPNGSGKSTTAKIALGIYKNIEGKVAKYTNKIGYVPQKISIDWTLPLRVKDFMVLTENIKDDQINEALLLTGVMHLKNKNLGNLSGGEFQRVLLARAISKKPDLLVLDEPVQGVDFTGEIALYELIKKISDELNCGIIWTDADARFKSAPKLFAGLEEYDFGCYWIPNVWNQPRNSALKPWSRGNEALNGSTLYFNNTESSCEDKCCSASSIKI